MMWLWFKRLSPAALCAMVAMLGGVAGGATAVNGLKQNTYGPTSAPVLVRSDPASEYADGSYGGYIAGEESVRCEQCSERDLGYRWASLAEVRRPDQCPSDSWGFRRGCLDYTGGI